MDLFPTKFNYLVYALLMTIGLYGMVMKRNLMKKLIGMNIFQWSIILYYISIGAKKGATVPVIPFSMGEKNFAITSHLNYVNPLPHVLMLTAIVVGVATTGIALALLILIQRRHGTIEEDQIIEKLKKK